MNAFLLIFGALLPLAALPPAGSNTDEDAGFRLKIAKVADISVPQVKNSCQPASKLDHKPSKFTLARGITLNNPAYFMTMLGGEKTFMALDPNARTLAIDMDCDGKITRKELFTGIPYTDHSSAVQVKDALLFGPIYLQLWEVKRTAAEFRSDNQSKAEAITPESLGVSDFNEIEGVWFYIKTYGDRSLALYLARYWTGRVPMGVGFHNIALLDADFDGVFTMIKRIEDKHGDKIAIDLRDNGLMTRSEIFTLRDKMGVEGHTYRVAVKWDGSLVRLDEYRQQILIGPPPHFAGPVNWGALTKCRAGG